MLSFVSGNSIVELLINLLLQISCSTIEFIISGDLIKWVLNSSETFFIAIEYLRKKDSIIFKPCDNIIFKCNLYLI
jgi:hypothetical protein